MSKQKRNTTKRSTKGRTATKQSGAAKRLHPNDTSTASADVRENPVTTEIEVNVQPLGGETILSLEDEQPLIGTASGASWDYVPDPQVLEVLEETERVDTSNNGLAEALRAHHSESPILAGGDMDADWGRANDVGEESVGGTVATPDQDRVDEMGEAVGIVYQDDEPLKTEDKLQKRDRDRWELNPASKDETER